MENQTFMYALVLFDIDGCTAIVDCKKLQSKTQLTKGKEVDLHLGKEIYKVEVLEFSDSKSKLNKFEETWSNSSRSKALDKAKNEKDIYDGYLLVRASDGNEVVGEHEENEVADDADSAPQVEGAYFNNEENESMDDASSVPEVLEATDSPRLQGQNDNTKEGQNGRKIVVLYEGSGENSTEICQPKRDPFFLEGLSCDEIDLIMLQVTEHSSGKKSSSAQTDNVVIIGHEDDPRQLFHQPNSRDAAVQCSLLTDDLAVKTKKDSSQVEGIGKKLDMILAILGVSEGKLDTILSLIRGFGSLEVDMDAILQQITSPNQSTEEIQTEPAPVVSNVQVTSSSPLLETDTVLPTVTQAVTDVTPTVVSTPPGPLAISMLPQATPIRSSNNTFRLVCSEGRLYEISSWHDMAGIPEAAEVRVKQPLTCRLQEKACSTGNFAWSLAQILFKEEELLGRNYRGKKGKPALSPRRVHAIEHTIMACYGSSRESLREVITAINTGIRNMQFKSKIRLPFQQKENL